MQLIGDCRDEKLVESIFGSVSEFARQLEIRKRNSFLFEKKIMVTYDEDDDIHYFYARAA
jgi:hypothetical protein